MKIKSPSFLLICLPVLSILLLVFSCKTSQVDKTFSKVFEGRLEKGPDLCMEVNSSDKKIKGSYFYKADADKITLSGELFETDSILMNEFDKSGNLFGVFRGKFVSPSRIEGTWSKPDGSKVTLFFLSETNFTYDALFEESKVVLDKQTAEEAQAEVQKSNAQKIDRDKKAIAANISEYLVLSTTASTDKKAKGIAGAEISLLNKSGYLMDKVTVRVNFLNKKGSVESTTLVEFSAIKSGATVSKPLADNKKAFSLDYVITQAEASRIRFTYQVK